MVTGFTECFATKSSHHRRLTVQGNAVQAYGADLREVAPGMQQADLPRRAEITAYVVRERCGTARQGDLKGESPWALAWGDESADQSSESAPPAGETSFEEGDGASLPYLRDSRLPELRLRLRLKNQAQREV